MMAPYDCVCQRVNLEEMKEEMERFRTTTAAFLNGKDCPAVNVLHAINHCVSVVECRIARIEKILEDMKANPQSQGMTPEQMTRLMGLGKDGD